jgi:hypothetical protein
MTHPHTGPPETSSNKERSDTQQFYTAVQGNTTTQSDLGATRTWKYHSTDMTEEWQQHNYNTVNTQKTVIELASHIKITSKTSNITAPNRNIWWLIQTHRYVANTVVETDTQYLAAWQKARPPPTPPQGSLTQQGLHRNTAEHTNTQGTGKLFQTIYTPLQRNLPTHKTGLNIHLLTHTHTHTFLSTQAREFSHPRPLKPLPRHSTTKEEQETTNTGLHTGEHTPTTTSVFYITFILGSLFV